ncbi:hypothetical protein Y1Q_0006051 [Alligator mississippiensis]|uniref:Uncharacterized protein n=1 Tax=Alligator mississippiensis TaxID=8496 RepID=A0A151N3W5_ALLMI|nr:hypothetical protein Y1Q_0006051 [Alligator mississippiensis]
MQEPQPQSSGGERQPGHTSRGSRHFRTLATAVRGSAHLQSLVDRSLLSLGLPTETDGQDFQKQLLISDTQHDTA